MTGDHQSCKTQSRLFDRTADGRSTSKKFQCIYGRFRFYIIGGRKRFDHRCTDAKAYFYYACPCGNEGPLLECVKAIHSLLDRTPPEVRKAIYENGIFLTGGLANMPGLEIYIEQMVGIKSRTALEPDTCAVNGLKRIIMSKDLRKLTFSMIEDNYRWMR